MYLKEKETLQILESNDSERIQRVLEKLDHSLSHMGHQFKVKQFYKIMDCTVCHEALWGETNQGLECGGMFDRLKTQFVKKFAIKHVYH